MARDTLGPVPLLTTSEELKTFRDFPSIWLLPGVDGRLKEEEVMQDIHPGSSPAQSHTIQSRGSGTGLQLHTEWGGLEETSEGCFCPTSPARAGSLRENHLGTNPGRFGYSPEVAAPQPLGNLFQCSASVKSSPRFTLVVRTQNPQQQAKAAYLELTALPHRGLTAKPCPDSSVWGDLNLGKELWTSHCSLTHFITQEVPPWPGLFALQCQNDSLQG